jgi:hypothetical protein
VTPAEAALARTFRWTTFGKVHKAAICTSLPALRNSAGSPPRASLGPRTSVRLGTIGWFADKWMVYRRHLHWQGSRAERLPSLLLRILPPCPASVRIFGPRHFQTTANIRGQESAARMDQGSWNQPQPAMPANFTTRQPCIFRSWDYSMIHRSRPSNYYRCLGGGERTTHPNQSSR